ncbi:hypothetical protein IFR04_002872 [Cadophora malorum]|uniref:Uncharacterized protein n=1 Tax=Cadophora malorum TaxID=108018 RepID=A0A8H7WFT9_9HELO|nr:hypothetical protein IFR04_002872 [Cadophora malorum]
MPPSDLKPKLKPILRHRPRPKCVRFLAKTINLETGSVAPVVTKTAKPSHQATKKTSDTRYSTERNVVITTGTSRESSRSRSRSPYKRASSPYPGKISSASTQTLQEHLKKPGPRPASSRIASYINAKEVRVTAPGNDSNQQNIIESHSQAEIKIETRDTYTDTRAASFAIQHPRYTLHKRTFSSIWTGPQRLRHFRILFEGKEGLCHDPDLAQEHILPSQEVMKW